MEHGTRQTITECGKGLGCAAKDYGMGKKEEDVFKPYFYIFFSHF